MKHERTWWLVQCPAVRATLMGAYLLACAGCTETEEDVTGEASHAVAPVLELGAVEMDIYAGTSRSDGFIAWSIGFSDVVRPSGSSSQSLSSGTTVVTFTESSMQAADGSVQCWFVENDLVDSDGDVVLRNEGSHVYTVQSQPIPLGSTPPFYRFAGPVIFLGLHGPPAASATEDLQHAEPALKLLIAALIHGVCGGDGL